MPATWCSGKWGCQKFLLTYLRITLTPLGLNRQLKRRDRGAVNMAWGNGLLQEKNIPDNVSVILEMFKEREILRHRFMKSIIGINKNSNSNKRFHGQANTLCFGGMPDEFMDLRKQLIIIKQFFQAKSISLFIFDKKKQKLQLNTTTGKPLGQNNSEILIRVSEKAFGEKDPVIISDIIQHESAKFPDETEAGSMLAAQLVFNKKVLGVLLFYKKDMNGFDAKHVQFYKLYADEIARSIALQEQGDH